MQTSQGWVARTSDDRLHRWEIRHGQVQRLLFVILIVRSAIWRLLCAVRTKLKAQERGERGEREGRGREREKGRRPIGLFSLDAR